MKDSRLKIISENGSLALIVFSYLVLAFSYSVEIFAFEGREDEKEKT